MRDHQPSGTPGAARDSRQRPAAGTRRVRDALDRDLPRRPGAQSVVVIQRKLEVTYLPFDRSTRVPPGTTLFSAAHWIGLPIDSTCGGRGTCGKCKVRILGAATEITDADHRELRQDEIAGGWSSSTPTSARFTSSSNRRPWKTSAATWPACTTRWKPRATT